ncbi:MAG: hypothetical protein IJ819_07485 [Clostridiales bacterium]|nr:hypothetical protein [Clostridiales bacterium]
MRRDYFTCVFLGLIAGALMFVCFAPLYFVYGSVVPREFSLFERLMSLLYALFFVFFLPFFAAFRSKVWINWGLAAYGVLIYLPKFFYPAEAVLTAEDPSFTKMLLAICLRGIYGMMQAPFAALSSLIGDKAAASLVYWILPLALFWPFVMKVFRFYRRAYLSEQLNPMPKVKPVAAAAHTGPAVKPEVLGTVITAPVVAASPDEVKGKAALAQNKKESAEALPGEKEEAVALPGEEKEEAIALSAPEPKPESRPEPKPESMPESKPESKPEAKTPEVIELSAPAAPVISPAIAPVEPEDSASGTVIELGAPPASSGTDSDSGHSDV